MLKKLMKHELKATARILIPLCLVLLFISVINRFLYHAGSKEGIFLFVSGLMFILQFFLVIAVLAATVIFMIMRFYKNLLSDEGYLMFTLPVKSHHLIISKLIVTLLWVVVSIIAIIASLLITFAATDDISIVMNAINSALAELKAYFGGNWVLVWIELISLTLLSAIANILLVYVSIAVGHLFTKHKIICSFVSYVIFYNAIQLLMLIVLVTFSYFHSGSINFAHMLPQEFFPVIIIVLLLECVAFYWTTNFIFNRKLNLE